MMFLAIRQHNSRASAHLVTSAFHCNILNLASFKIRMTMYVYIVGRYFVAIITVAVLLMRMVGVVRAQHRLPAHRRLVLGQDCTAVYMRAEICPVYAHALGL